MGRAEVGSTKWQANRQKMVGLQRLRWWCQPCEKQCRDENGFKQHTMSEGHVRTMLSIGEDPRKHIHNYSTQFQRDFLSLLRTAHGEKKVIANHFYQEYIADKQHIHMNSTRWNGLTEFVKHLGREGICRVEEGERGLEVAWIDSSPEAIKRKEASANKSRLARGDEEREAKRLEEQIRRAEAQQAVKSHADAESQAEDTPTDEPSDQPVSFSLSGKHTQAQTTDSKVNDGEAGAEAQASSSASFAFGGANQSPQDSSRSVADMPAPSQANTAPVPIEEKKKDKPFNPFKSSKSKGKAKEVSAATSEPAKKMSQAEIIMRREIDQAGRGGIGGIGGSSHKRQRLT